ncbi:hypothetical protein A7C91_03575 [Thermococcus piezophilus]|uniref:Glycosyltransferase subfamily 4-like N-terminal domain-containing protein n=2 Tax=Thermococcus piezophilus TaxID=1712654 RepID=A0A172WG94_9EURY|nr:hypothetical protein A7C91_03575 [Thermococcus piezophilus]
MRVMKVVMTVSNPFKPDPRVYKEARSLVKHGYEVTIIAWDREGKYSKEELFEGIKIKRIKLKSRYGNFLDFGLKLPLFYIKALVILLEEDFDVIHTHDFDTALLGLFMKILKGRRWIYDVHDLYFTYFSNKALRRIIKTFDILFAGYSDIVLVATQSLGKRYQGLREFYIENGIHSEKIVTIWNVPCLKEFLNYEKLDLKKSKKITIGFIGSIRTLTNFVSLFEAIKHDPHLYKVIFVGNGKYLKKLRKIVENNYSQLDVEFIGHISYRLIPNYYKLCDLILALYPPQENVSRAIAIKVFESAVLGIPCIVPAGTLMEDFVKEYRCGIAIKEEIENLRENIVKIKKIKFNPEIIRKRWNWQREERKLIKIYESIVRDTQKK